MFYKKDNPKLKKLGIKDSKLLTPKKREQLYEKIIKMAKAFEIIIVYPHEIDDVLNDENTNLNWLEADKTIEIINKLKPEKAIVDCPSNNIEAYTNYLAKKLEVKCVLIVEHKADLHHVESAAASILAKVTRDREIEEIKKEIKVDFGSGYPSDPKTIVFLEKNWDKYDFFRKSWDSWKKAK